ncbi:MAG: LysE family transporter [Thermoanaerobaculia bacterium]
MSSFPLTLIVGLATGFFGAIPPGPLNITIIRKASEGDARAAFKVGLGGAIIDTLICALIGLGFTQLISGVVTNHWVKGALSLFLIAYGLKVLIWDRKRDATNEAKLKQEREDDPEGVAARMKKKGTGFAFVVGLLQGAANPTLFVNWTLIIGFFVGHRLLEDTVSSAVAFALGVGLGVFGWFALLIEMLVRLKNHPVGAWLRRSTVLAGFLLVAFGIVFTVRTLQGL